METINIFALLSGIAVTTAAFTWFDTKNAKRLKQRGADLRRQIRLNHEMDLRNAELAMELRELKDRYKTMMDDVSNVNQTNKQLNASFQEWQSKFKSERDELTQRIQDLKNERDELAAWKENKLQIKRNYHARKKGA